FVMDFEIWSNDGAILSDLANDYKLLTIVPEQAYVQAHNVFIKGLDIWLGSRLYRKNDVHIADYFYFNSLPGQGLGVMYKNLDTAILVNTGSSPFFQADLNQGSMAPGVVPEVVKRIRTIFVAQYKYPFGHRSSYVQGLGEFHVVPRLQDAAHVAPNGLDPQDWGWVLGAKAHFDLGRDQFNDMSFRYGTRIANGAASGRTTYDTFGDTALDGTYKGAYGIEVVDHFMWNVGHIFSLNGYGTLHYNRGALDYVPAAAAVGGPPPVVGPNTRLDFAVGARPVVYLHKMFQLMAEATYQGRKDEGKPMGTVLKLAIAPTVVPTGSKGDYWARPHIRAMYVFGYYNQAAVDQLQSPYLKTAGPTRYAHFIGARAEWWFY
ncbi:MAG TPA: carbohydrate porin, partial [Polyangia bacterium]|nr:carbohydrate porin [Polyangia bacterium]